MSEHLPQNLSELVPAIFWGIFAFAFGFEAVVELNAGSYTLVVLDIAGCFICAAIAMIWWRHREWLPNKLVNTTKSICTDARWLIIILLILFCTNPIASYYKKVSPPPQDHTENSQNKTTNCSLIGSNNIAIGAGINAGINAGSAADKRAMIRSHLQQFYIEAGKLLDTSFSLPNDISAEDFKKYSDDEEAWTNKVADWIGDNMGAAAREKFLDKTAYQYVLYDKRVNQNHNFIINALVDFRKNLSILIETNAYDK